MNSQKFTQTLISGALITFSFNIHYGYYDYIQMNKIVPNYNIFYLNFFMLLLGLAGLVRSVTQQINSMMHYILLASAILIYISTIAIMYQDVAFLKKDREFPYTGKLLRPDVWLLVNALGWLLLGYSIHGNKGSDKDRMVSVTVAMGIVAVLFWMIRESRMNSIVDAPGYAIMILLFTILSYYNSVGTKKTNKIDL